MCGVHVSSATQVQSFLVFIGIQSFRGKDITVLISILQPAVSHNCINSRFTYSNQYRQTGTSCSNHLLDKKFTETTISLFTRKFGGQRSRFPLACCKLLYPCGLLLEGEAGQNNRAGLLYPPDLDLSPGLLILAVNAWKLPHFLICTMGLIIVIEFSPPQ